MLSSEKYYGSALLDGVGLGMLSPYLFPQTIERRWPKLYPFSTFVGAACANQFRTFADLAEKLKMDVT
jgi:hypothetical protein